MERRELLKYLSFTPFIGVVKVPEAPASATVKRDLFKELGVRTFINAAGTYTAMTGSLMQDIVVDTIADASREFCMLDEVQDKVGEKIAALVHAETEHASQGAYYRQGDESEQRRGAGYVYGVGKLYQPGP